MAVMSHDRRSSLVMGERPSAGGHQEKSDCDQYQSQPEFTSENDPTSSHRWQRKCVPSAPIRRRKVGSWGRSLRPSPLQVVHLPA
ncbi:protein of unknown function [Bradyrhizobium vignae]|uniref:Uncharacterized protein n=1 Tax=Bradyrhizobium vignae TaxID=1549949 RepID=A0A2U3Q6I0_9BRAD|nr:protein of unknown function [Bradyrhizobium vignae]